MKKIQTYSEFIVEQTDNTIKYSEYLGESIQYGEYIAENLDKSIEYQEYLIKHITEPINHIISGTTLKTILTYDIVADPVFTNDRLTNIREFIPFYINKNELFDHLNGDLVKWRTSTKFHEDDTEVTLGNSFINGHEVIRKNNEFFIKVPFSKEKEYLINRFNYLSQVNGSILDTLERMYQNLNQDEIDSVLNSLPNNSFKECYINSAKTYREIEKTYRENYEVPEVSVFIGATSMSGTTSIPGTTGFSGSSGASGVYNQNGREIEKPSVKDTVPNFSNLLFRKIIDKLFPKKQLKENEEIYEYRDFSKNFYQSLEEFKEFEKLVLKQLNYQ